MPPDSAQPICGLTGEDYQQVLADLFPVGAAWPRDLDSVFMQTLRAMAEEFARWHQRACDLLDESYPCGALETLADWERIAGLPDLCTGPLPTTQERQLAVCLKLAARGGQSKAYYLALAASLGIQIKIVTYTPFRASISVCGDPLYSGDWAYAWGIIAPEVIEVFFRAGLSAAGEPLVSWGNRLLECIIRQSAPAHTVPLFIYSLVASFWDDGHSVWDEGASIWDEVENFRLHGEKIPALPVTRGP